MRLTTRLFILSFVILFHPQTTFPENQPPLSETARVELEKYRMDLAAKNKRLKIELDAENKKKK